MAQWLRFEVTLVLDSEEVCCFIEQHNTYYLFYPLLRVGSSQGERKTYRHNWKIANCDVKHPFTLCKKVLYIPVSNKSTSIDSDAYHLRFHCLPKFRTHLSIERVNMFNWHVSWRFTVCPSLGLTWFRQRVNMFNWHVSWRFHCLPKLRTHLV